MNDNTPHDDTDDFFFGYPTEQAEAFFAAQLDFVQCLCSLGEIWRIQQVTDVGSIPIEAKIHGV